MGKLEETYISGEPVPKGRPRFTRSGRTYTPKKTLDHERAIREAWESGKHEPGYKAVRPVYRMGEHLRI